MRRRPTHLVLQLLVRLFALMFNVRPALRAYLRGKQGTIDFTIGLRTESNSAEAALAFSGGRVRASGRIPPDADVTLIFADDSVVHEMLRATPSEVLNLLLKSRMRTEGSLTYLNLFNFYLTLLLGTRDGKSRAGGPADAATARAATAEAATASAGAGGAAPPPRGERLRAASRDPGVHVLEDPYLADYSLDDFPRLRRFLDLHFETRPELCHERPQLVTEWCEQHGFETQPSGEPWIPELRQAEMLRYLLENRRPLIREGDLLAGTTTARDVGVVVYPDAHGTMIWGELQSLPGRELNPYDVSDETVRVLHHEVFPYWARRNFREWVRERYDNPLCQQLDERFAVYFLWKTVALSHTIPDFPKILRLGTRGITAEIDAELARGDGEDPRRTATLQAMKISLAGLATYARNLAHEAARQAQEQQDPARKAELEHIAEICARVPEHPARTLDEAVQAVWLTWVALHMESTNAGLSIGRLDQWLQPYFEADAAKLETAAEREAYVRHAIELVGCFYMRCTDHLPLIPDIGNYLFGGSSSDQAITLGGVTPTGEDGVNDMTYIFLLVTQLLGIRDPNVNARFHPGVNSDTYLRRLCEVNLITTATPSMHNDAAVLTSTEELGYPIEARRDWAATGCVEPTVCGRHIGHTNSMMMSLVAALEMALNDGLHPLMRWKVGPSTGPVEGFESFDAFFEAFATQMDFLVGQAVAYNNMLGEAHAELRPTPLLSSLIEDCIAGGRDVTRGGARYNSSGAACIGLTDVTDSLMAVKKLVFDEQKVDFATLARAVRENFEGHAALQAMARNKVPLFGSGSPEAVDMARRVAKRVHEAYRSRRNFRGGPYTAGFWSMSNHVAFGTLAGALPSGRPAGKAFTPGLTPQAHASKSLLDNIRDVASLEPRHMSNNMAFNVKVVPAPGEDHARAVEMLFGYVRSYFGLGGMQMQMNVVTSAMLRDAMAHPEQYRNLLVRISGYNAYFVTLNRDMQLELIERAEYGAA